MTIEEIADEFGDSLGLTPEEFVGKLIDELADELGLVNGNNLVAVLNGEATAGATAGTGVLTGGADSDDLNAYGTGVQGDPGPADRDRSKEKDERPGTGVLTGGADSDDLNAYGTGVQGDPGPAVRNEVTAAALLDGDGDGDDDDELDAYGTGVQGDPGPADRLNEKGGE